MARKRKKGTRKSFVVGQSRPDDEGLLWVQEVQVRPSRAECRAQSRLSRWRNRLRLKAKRSHPVEEDGDVSDAPHDDDSDNSEFDDDEPRQYTIAKLKNPDSLWTRLRHTANRVIDTDEFAYKPNSWFILYINWTFQNGFWMVFLSFLVIFLLLTFAFGGFLKLAGDIDPGCIIVSGEDFGYNPDTKLADAFALSWTTFTTVGYGMTYTATGTDHEDQTGCLGIVFLCTMESFVGLLYAGLCAAILFGKVGRIQSHAQVKFSNALCIELSKPNQPVLNGGGKSGTEIPQEEDSEMDAPACGVPCPVLKFQLINKLCNMPGGEIMDANIKAVAGNKGAEATVSSFVKVNLAEFEHPFFSRVWQGRHILGENSSLLTPFARSMIRRNGGSWPADWNNPKHVRSALKFTDLIVTLTGISNVSAATVHGYKKYKYGDLLVGYEFAPVLYKQSDSNVIRVDMSLVDDVVEQTDGRAECFGEAEEEQHRGSEASFRSIQMLESHRA